MLQRPPGDLATAPPMSWEGADIFQQNEGISHGRQIASGRAGSEEGRLRDAVSSRKIRSIAADRPGLLSTGYAELRKSERLRGC